MQSEPKPHIGLPEGAPSEVKWSNKSFLEPVETAEEFNLRPYVIFLSFFWLPLLFTGLLILMRHMPLPEGDGTDKLNLVGSCVFLIGVADLFLLGHLLKYISIRFVKRREGRLFEPDWKSILVYIEDSGTFNKMKLVSNDFGLLRAYNGCIDIEMMNHRAHLAVKDISVSISGEDGRKKSIRGVQLVTKADAWPWDITLVAPVQNWSSLLGPGNHKRATWLLKRIQKDVTAK
jgi:hypothetical protein